MLFPDLSIIIPTYNRLPLLKEALNSFVGLLDCSYEVIIVDDGSTDGTADFLLTLQDPYRAFFQEHKGGNVARNYGLSEAQGRYTKFFDDDDWLNAQMVNTQVRYLDVHQDIDICYSDFAQVLESGSINFASKTFNTTLENIFSGKNRYKIGYPLFAYTLRTEKASSINWDESLSSAQDLDYFLRALLGGLTFAYIPGCVGWVRHDRGRERVSVTEHRHEERLTNYVKVLETAEGILEGQGRLTFPVRKALGQAHFRTAVSFYRLDHDSKALKARLMKVRTLDPNFEPERSTAFCAIAKQFGVETALKLSIFYRGLRRALHLS